MSRRKVALSTGLAVVLAIICVRRVATADDTYEIEIQKAVEYGTGGEEMLRLDLATPKGAPGLRPGLVFIHGGAWRAGTRDAHWRHAQEAARRGYVAVTITYRLAPKHHFPAQVEDCKCAVRWLRANAERLNLDPNRIGAVGFSAGAHLALMLGTMDAGDGLEGAGGSAGYSSKVQAAVSYFGPIDLDRDFLEEPTRILETFLGASRQEKPEAYKLASPVTYVNEGDAAMLLFQGTKDPLVPWQQATTMADALSKANVAGRIEVLVGEGHGWADEEFERTDAATFAFLEQHLKP